MYATALELIHERHATFGPAARLPHFAQEVGGISDQFTYHSVLSVLDIVEALFNRHYMNGRLRHMPDQCARIGPSSSPEEGDSRRPAEHVAIAAKV